MKKQSFSLHFLIPFRHLAYNTRTASVILFHISGNGCFFGTVHCLHFHHAEIHHRALIVHCLQLCYRFFVATRVGVILESFCSKFTHFRSQRCCNRFLVDSETVSCLGVAAFNDRSEPFLVAFVLQEDHWAHVSPLSAVLHYCLSAINECWRLPSSSIQRTLAISWSSYRDRSKRIIWLMSLALLQNFQIIMKG